MGFRLQSTRETATSRERGQILVLFAVFLVVLVFLPSQFGFGSLSVRLPTALPAYRVYVMVE